MPRVTDLTVVVDSGWDNGGMGEYLDVDGHRIAVTNLGKVLYPAAGTRKFDVIDYYNRIAPAILPQLADRPVTRKRWPNGVSSAPFFEKDLPTGAPDWIEYYTADHKDRSSRYPLITDRAGLIWLAQLAALELHVPQWRITDGRADRLVLDLDPGPDVSLADCAAVAREIRELLDGAGLTGYPVTSGGKGIHIYARLPQPVSSDAARTVAKQIATSLAARHPDRITAVMAKAQRSGRVFIDWSQNSRAKTTLCPYSLRGRERPWAAAPRHWSELDDPALRQLEFTEVLERFETEGDLLAGLLGDGTSEAPATTPTIEVETDEPGSAQLIDLAEYRRKRDADRTPEPFGDTVTRQTREESADPAEPIFVVGEHHARRLHYDFRLERDGVLVSWAVPKNLPDDPQVNRLAIQTEDHPLDYADFSGEIPAGEYGAGIVRIFDRGTYRTEKWREDEIIVDLHGDRFQGRYALIRTDGKQWLIHRMSEPDVPVAPVAEPVPRDLRPMLASTEAVDTLDGGWAFEGKWDGYRVLIRLLDGRLTLTSRSGIDLTADYPVLAPLADDLAGLDVVLDGELVVIDPTGRTDFSLLASHRSDPADHRLRLYLFDILHLNGRSLLRLPWESRRRLLEELGHRLGPESVAEVPDLLSGPGSVAVEQSRQEGLEGVVAKRRDAAYQPGSRSPAWRKQKNWSDIEVVIGGWRPGRGSRRNRIGSLLLGLPEETGLRYVGRVGTGFSDAALTEIAAELEPLRISLCPFLDIERPVATDAVWVLPKLVCEVQFMGWTAAGQLRHPSWRGMRRDKLPGDL